MPEFLLQYCSSYSGNKLFWWCRSSRWTASPCAIRRADASWGCRSLASCHTPHRKAAQVANQRARADLRMPRDEWARPTPVEEFDDQVCALRRRCASASSSCAPSRTRPRRPTSSRRPSSSSGSRRTRARRSRVPRAARGRGTADRGDRTRVSDRDSARRVDGTRSVSARHPASAPRFREAGLVRAGARAGRPGASTTRVPKNLLRARRVRTGAGFRSGVQSARTLREIGGPPMRPTNSRARRSKSFRNKPVCAAARTIPTAIPTPRGPGDNVSLSELPRREVGGGVQIRIRCRTYRPRSTVVIVGVLHTCP